MRSGERHGEKMMFSNVFGQDFVKCLYRSAKQQRPFNTRSLTSPVDHKRSNPTEIIDNLTQSYLQKYL